MKLHLTGNGLLQQIAEMLGAEEIKIPDTWKTITWEKVKGDLKNIIQFVMKTLQL